MTTEKDPDVAIEMLRAWKRDVSDQPISAAYSKATATLGAKWVFRQESREESLQLSGASVELLQSRDQIKIRPDGPGSSWRAYPIY